MLVWFAETTLVATVLAAAALLAGRWLRLGPMARHALWLVVLVKLVAPPIVSWPWSERLMWPSHEAAEAPIGPSMATVELRGTTPPTRRAEAPARTIDPRHTVGRVAPPALALIGRRVLGVWGVASVALALWQVGRVVRFRRQFRWAVPAPGWLVEEARRIGGRLGVRVPEILVVPGPMTPMLWCLGRPKLILPARLVETLGAVGWRGILAHELAHVLRRDHWVRHLELAAGLLWWWNPLFWLTRRRLGAEAELACDEWAVRALPEERLAYAEALLEVCRSLSMAEPPVPALGVAGSGRFLERRVTMILRDQAPPRATTPVLIGAGLLALLALPAWSVSGSSAQKPDTPADSAPSRVSNDPAVVPDDDTVDVVPADAEETAGEDDDRSADRPKRHGQSRTAVKRGAERRDGPDSAIDPDDDRADAGAADISPKARDKWIKPAHPDDRPRRLEDKLLLDEVKTKTYRRDDKPATVRKKSPDLLGAAKTDHPNDEADRSDDQPANKLRHPDARPEEFDDTVATVRKKSADLFGATKTRHPDARPDTKPDGPKKAASDGRKVERRTRSQRINEMRALIDQLHQELKALEVEDRDGEDQ